MNNQNGVRQGEESPLKAITFLGTTRYRETTYVRSSGDGVTTKVTTPYFPVAVPQFYPAVSELLLLATPTVLAHNNVRAVEAALGPLLTLQEIPEGHTESDLWTIFDVLTSIIDEGDRVVFDITNSLRSLPFVTFLAAAYLRAAKNVTVEAILYGAYEARDEATNESPVFDLTPFVSLLDWLSATNQFIYTGDARYLASLLSKAGQTQRSLALGVAGRELRELSLAMMLCRPLAVMDRAGKLQTALTQAEDDLSDYARPFGLLAQRIQTEYAGRALSDPTKPENVEDSLRHQLSLILWYFDNNQIMQGVTLAREWLVTAVGWRLGYNFALDKSIREGDEWRGIQWGLTGLCRLGKPEQDGGVVTLDDVNCDGHRINEWAERDQLIQLSRKLNEVRNELDHAGMNRKEMEGATLAQKAQKAIWPELAALAELWGLRP